MPRSPRTAPLSLTLQRRQWMRWALGSLAAAGAALGLAPRNAQARPMTTLVEAVQLPAWVERHGQRRPAQPGIALRAGDKALTAAAARLLLRMPDRSQIKLGEATELLIEAMNMQPLGVAYFTVAVTLLTTSLALIAAPFGYFFADAGLDINFGGYYTAANAPWLLPLVSIAGVLLLFATLHLARGIGKLHGLLAKHLLVHNPVV